MRPGDVYMVESERITLVLDKTGLAECEKGSVLLVMAHYGSYVKFLDEKGRFMFDMFPSEESLRQWSKRNLERL
jgi:hypothetical protein